MATAAAQKTVFNWVGKDAKGQTVKGEMASKSADLIKAQLRRQGITPTKVLKQKPIRGGSSKITAGDISIFARQLTTMMGSGVPLVQAFEIVANGLENKAMARVVSQIKADVEGGSSLTVALKNHPEHFDDLFCNLVEAGEQSGTLERLLNEVATYKEKTEALRAKIKSALFYPVAVLIVAFIVTAILLVFVVPQFETLFEGVGGDLPAFTKMVVNLSEFMQQWWWIIFGSIAGAVFLFKAMHKKSQNLRDKTDALVLKLPIIGEIIHKASTSKFARTLATMSSAGVPLVEAMDSVAGASGNAIYRDAVLRMKDDTSTGQRLTATMREQNLFSNMAVQMVSIGEESGALDDMLAKVADYYEEEVDNAVDALTSLMEPLIMAFLGVVVGGLVVAMYLPIFKMGDAF
ncbi:type II secretion system protein F [Chromatiales bacterium (ex Bugula neritina AB1)]|nr:type II secretion system protein F [Chromatiales bacterium (ex Bugula neritina AB1)]